MCLPSLSFLPRLLAAIRHRWDNSSRAARLQAVRCVALLPSPRFALCCSSGPALPRRRALHGAGAHSGAHSSRASAAQCQADVLGATRRNGSAIDQPRRGSLLRPRLWPPGPRTAPPSAHLPRRTSLCAALLCSAASITDKLSLSRENVSRPRSKRSLAASGHGSGSTSSSDSTMDCRSSRSVPCERLRGEHTARWRDWRTTFRWHRHWRSVDVGVGVACVSLFLRLSLNRGWIVVLCSETRPAPRGNSLSHSFLAAGAPHCASGWILWRRCVGSCLAPAPARASSERAHLREGSAFPAPS